LKCGAGADVRAHRVHGTWHVWPGRAGPGASCQAGGAGVHHVARPRRGGKAGLHSAPLGVAQAATRTRRGWGSRRSCGGRAHAEQPCAPLPCLFRRSQPAASGRRHRTDVVCVRCSWSARGDAIFSFFHERGPPPHRGRPRPPSHNPPAARAGPVRGRALYASLRRPQAVQRSTRARPPSLLPAIGDVIHRLMTSSHGGPRGHRRRRRRRRPRRRRT